MDDPDFYNLLYLGCNYEISLVRNLAVILCLVAAVFLLWVLMSVLQVSLKCCCKQSSRQEAWWCNLQVRLLYELYFEVCLCLMISFSLQHESTAVEKLISFALLLVVVAILVLMTGCCFKGGPFLKGSYAKHSLINSFWHYRALEEKYLAEIQNELEQERKIQIDTDDVTSKTVTFKNIGNIREQVKS